MAGSGEMLNYAQRWLLALSGNGYMPPMRRIERSTVKLDDKTMKSLDVYTPHFLFRPNNKDSQTTTYVASSGPEEPPISVFILKGGPSRFGDTPHLGH